MEDDLPFKTLNILPIKNCKKIHKDTYMQSEHIKV